MRARDLPADLVEAELLRLLGYGMLGRALDIGTGTGRLLEFLAPRLQAGVGIDASPTMLALARVRLAKPDLSHLTVRQADMYALPFRDASFDVVLLHMVLHSAEDCAAAIAEARRVLAADGRLVVVDLAPHGRAELRERMAHRMLGFSDEDISRLLHDAGLVPGDTGLVAGPLRVRIWTARPSADAAAQPANRFEDAL
jgi:ArsR family transcriptional regulator